MDNTNAHDLQPQYSYQIGSITFLVTPVYCELGETLAALLKKLMDADIERI